MTDKAMTDKEIIKALECCHKGRAECEECPLWHTSGANADCVDRLTGSALNLINRQKEEIERLKDIAELSILSELIYIWENETIKEFVEKAEKIVELVNRADGGYDIDELVKEMVGEE